MPSLPPGPVAPPAVQTLRFARAPFAFLDECTARYGEIFTLRLWGAPMMVSIKNELRIRS